MSNKKRPYPTATFAAVKWHTGILTLLDQRQLPGEVVYLEHDSATAVAASIKAMVVRGAPAIGIAAAYAVVLAARSAYQSATTSWRTACVAEIALLTEARPTAVNLQWAVATMCKAFNAIAGDPEPVLLNLARQIQDDDVVANHAMGRLGAALLAPASGVVTHCNAGALATGGYGTALGVIRTAFKNGTIAKVFVSETRPWFQGARLTSWELQQDKIPVQLVIDAAIASLMGNGEIDWLIVGADRIAANGDVANKIGTYAHAVSACYHGVKVMVVAPSSTVDMTTASGADIPIENRAATEITAYKTIQIAPNDIAASNPAFDITPAKLVDVIVTEKGIIQAPDAEKMLAMFG